ncbi:hypothetical protein CgunFtcFv8_025062 [Champsocephalus gunnari]|uniref:Uncharacterized protein n=1 Tax=Champsocephalus gunnari TaxID=52237 RepID=A0AAN8DFN3_CHAGU|nr:hypothetical protein CgunFtcFv8_025062 [Champsocephalus gunnari]
MERKKGGWLADWIQLNQERNVGLGGKQNSSRLALKLQSDLLPLRLSPDSSHSLCTRLMVSVVLAPL